jgi:hypothetical protein
MFPAFAALKARFDGARLDLEFSSDKEPSDILHRTQFLIRWTLGGAHR